eukprot:scaffold3720_cov141-Cylindrotheca_fusiformis.AAC.5
MSCSLRQQPHDRICSRSLIRTATATILTHSSRSQIRTWIQTQQNERAKNHGTVSTRAYMDRRMHIQR